MKPQLERWIDKNYGNLLCVILTIIFGISLCMCMTGCSIVHKTAHQETKKTDSTVNVDSTATKVTHVTEWQDTTVYSDADTLNTELEPDTAGEAYIETDDQRIEITQLAGNRRLKLRAIAKSQPVKVQVNKTTDIAENTDLKVQSHTIQAVSVKDKEKEKKPQFLANIGAIVAGLLVLAVIVWLYLFIRKQYNKTRIL